MYPNILHEEGIETMCQYLEIRSDRSTSTSTNSLCNIASIILKNNYFENGELKYRQKRSTAIGAKFALPHFMVGSQTLNKFLNCINSLYSAIKFTMGFSTAETNFLDVNVTKVGNKLETNLYCKPIDTHQYLHAQSCHRNVYKKSIAYAQAVRIKRICSTEEELNNRLKQLK